MIPVNHLHLNGGEMAEKRYVRRIVKREEARYQARQKYNAKLGPTQLYDVEKELVLAAVEFGKYDSISAYCREAVREKLERDGYEVPPESQFIKEGEEAEIA